MQKITPNLWFDTEAEASAQFYTSVFKNSTINAVSHYGSAGPQPIGTVMMVEFELDGVAFTALNGGSADFAFNEALSFIVNCDSQKEVDYYWQTLSESGEEGVCGWLKDKYGVSWQIIPTVMNDLITDPDPEKSQRAMKAMLKMTKIDIEKLKSAYNNED
jgi:predicted 3-demethylubiquinone-9 3-methyltransferase (glyoxalase superfamily)